MSDTFQIFNRCVESQSHAPLRSLTDTNEEYEFLEQFVEDSKPPYPGHQGYDVLIQTPFRYKLPVPDRYAARFRPSFFNKNVFYASAEKSTSLYETSYHFLRQRQHISDLSQTPEPRTLFTVGINLKTSFDVRTDADIERIMARDDYSASHAFVRNNPHIDVFLYPSCRCPKKGTNAAVLEITRIEKKPRSKELLHFVYDQGKKGVRIFSGQELILFILWKEVS